MLAQQAPDLRRMLERAKGEGFSHALLHVETGTAAFSPARTRTTAPKPSRSVWMPQDRYSDSGP